MKRLPPLNALRAFEATARLDGVTRASEELFVSHGAVSRHLKTLEDWLGVPLLDRSGHSISLTRAGRAYSQSISAALDLIVEATAQAQHLRPSQVLGVATTHSFASRWLVPRLNRFDEDGTEVWLTLEQTLTDFERSGLHAAIRSGQGPWPGLECTALMTDELVPLCSPDYLEQNGPIDEPEHLAGLQLLHDQDPDA